VTSGSARVISQRFALAHDLLGSVVFSNDPNDRDGGFAFCGRLELQEFPDRGDSVVRACRLVLTRCNPFQLSNVLRSAKVNMPTFRLTLDGG
jgi:hypothetical protein